MAFAEDGHVAVARERRVFGPADAIGVAFGRGDVEDDAIRLRLEGGDRGRAPVGAAAEDEPRADRERAERQGLDFGRGNVGA